MTGRDVETIRVRDLQRLHSGDREGVREAGAALARRTRAAGQHQTKHNCERGDRPRQYSTAHSKGQGALLPNTKIWLARNVRHFKPISREVKQVLAGPGSRAAWR